MWSIPRASHTKVTSSDMKDDQLGFLMCTCNSGVRMVSGPYDTIRDERNKRLTDAPSISHVSRTDLSTTVRSPFPKGA